MSLLLPLENRSYKQVIRDAIASQTIEHIKLSGNKKNYNIVSLPGIDWLFEKYLYQKAIQETESSLNFYCYEYDPTFFQKSNVPGEVIPVMGDKNKVESKLDRGRIVFRKDALVLPSAPIDLLWGDFCGQGTEGLTQKNVADMRLVADNNGIAYTTFSYRMDYLNGESKAKFNPEIQEIAKKYLDKDPYVDVIIRKALPFARATVDFYDEHLPENKTLIFKSFYRLVITKKNELGKEQEVAVMPMLTFGYDFNKQSTITKYIHDEIQETTATLTTKKAWETRRVLELKEATAKQTKQRKTVYMAKKNKNRSVNEKIRDLLMDDWSSHEVASKLDVRVTKVAAVLANMTRGR